MRPVFGRAGFRGTCLRRRLVLYLLVVDFYRPLVLARGRDALLLASDPLGRLPLAACLHSLLDCRLAAKPRLCDLAPQLRGQKLQIGSAHREFCP